MNSEYPPCDWLKKNSEENPHLAWLCVVAFCNGGTLKNANITDAMLVGADFSYTNLFGADFTGADLTRAKLYGANASGTNFTGARLVGANFIGATVVNADFNGANLSGTDFIGANISGADFNYADISGVDLTGAKFNGAYFDCNISETNIFTRDFRFKLEFGFRVGGVNRLELENKRDQLMNNEIHKFKQWYITRYMFHFEDETDFMMAKMILQ